MFDFGFSEIFVLSLVALIVLGPTRLPEIMRTCGLWLGRARRVYNNVRLEIEREVGMDDIRRQLHNEQIMAELEAVEQEARTFKREIEDTTREPVESAATEPDLEDKIAESDMDSVENAPNTTSSVTDQGNEVAPKKEG